MPRGHAGLLVFLLSMRNSASGLIVLVAPFVFTACATIGPPLPPSLALPKPPEDLRAARRGDRVTLTWSVPTLTTDRQSVRNVGKTRICRAVSTELTQCNNPLEEVSLQASPASAAGQKRSASYTDVLPSALESDNPSSTATYAVEILNIEGRGAGLSN